MPRRWAGRWWRSDWPPASRCRRRSGRVYRWQGAVESAPEQLLHVKTTARRVADLRRRLRDLHPYEVPELVVLPIVEGDPAYLAWLVESTAPGE